uniref:Uncharacterized protein n=1 Tax=termite gut metagenome TaxID=433724 RepID=S0DEN9_9ZZZZ
MEKISVASLSYRGIIDPDVLLHTVKYNQICKGFGREDAELWTLLTSGFTNRELMVIYGFTNINSICVKPYWLRSRLEKDMRQLIANR